MAIRIDLASLCLCALVATALATDLTNPSIRALNPDVIITLPMNGTLQVNTPVGTSAVVTEAVMGQLMATMQAQFDEKVQSLEAELSTMQETQTEIKSEAEASVKSTAIKIQDAIDTLQFGVVVAPGDSIADAIDGLTDDGGKIFLKRGFHNLTSTLVVSKSVTIVGEGVSTVVQNVNGGAAISFSGESMGSPLLHTTLSSVRVRCTKAKSIGVMLLNVESSFVEHVVFNGCDTDLLLTSSSKNWIQDNEMSFNASNPSIGGIEEAKNATQNVYRRNLYSTGFETNLLEAPKFSFSSGYMFNLTEGCEVTLQMLAATPVPSVNPFELEYLARVKRLHEVTMQSRYLATIDATTQLPEGVKLNSSTGTLVWKPSSKHGGKVFNISFLATGARRDISKSYATFTVAKTYNVALCKPVVDAAEEKDIPDPDEKCKTSADPQASTDGVRPNGMKWVDVGTAEPYITVDLNNITKIKNIVLFQPSKFNNRMKTAVIKVSDDGKEFSTVAQGPLAINSPGLLGANFDVSIAARYVQVIVNDRVSSGYGIGELEIYSSSVTKSVTGFKATSMAGSTAIKVQWDNPEEFDLIRLIRNDLKEPGSLKNYPSSPTEGTKVYEGTAEVFVDKSKELKAGERYFYSAFAYHKDSGWSLVSWESVDSVVAAPVNVNIAAYKPVRSTIDGTGLTDGSGTQGLTATSSKDVGDKLTAVIDLKSTSPIAEVHLYQHQGRNYHMLTAELSYSTDGVAYKKLSKLELDLSHPGSLAGVLLTQVSARYIKIELSDRGSYYWGLAELEIYSQRRPTAPQLTAKALYNTNNVQLTLTGTQNLKVRILRQKQITGGGLDNFPIDPEAGTKIYEGTGTKFTDTKLPSDVRQFYAAYVFHPSKGWSNIDFDAVESTLPGSPNPNIARDKKVTSSVDFNSRDPPHQVVDGNVANGVSTTDAGKVDDYVWVIIDLKRIETVNTVVLYHHGSINYFLRQAKLKVSTDMKNWETVAGSKLSLSHAGGMGATFTPGSKKARYVRLEVSGQTGYYFGVGEIQVFARPLNTPPTLFASQVKGTPQIKLDFSALSSTSKIVIMKKKLKSAGDSPSWRYALDRFDGIVVYDSTKTSGSFTDKDVSANTRYYYTAFGYSRSTGWSMFNYQAADTVLSLIANPNLLMDKMIYTNAGHQSVYGTANNAVNGQRRVNHAVTNSAGMAQGIKVSIDMKRNRPIRQIVIWQSSGHFEMTHYRVQYATNTQGTNWRQLASKEADVFEPGGLGMTLTFSTRNMRWIRVTGYGNAGYYYGIGEIEAYEQPTTKSPTDLIALNEKGKVALSWTAPSGTLVQLRRKKFSGSYGSPELWPMNPTDGILLVESKTQRTFIDATTSPNNQWYYAVYAYTATGGWSILQYTGLDNICSQCVNPNIARDKTVLDPTMTFQMAYGKANGGVDGKRTTGIDTTDNVKLEKKGGKISFIVDLKKVRRIRQIVAFQTAGYVYFGLNFVKVEYSTASSKPTGWNSFGDKEMKKDYIGGLGYVFKINTDIRFLRVTAWGEMGYYDGFGEIEVYETEMHTAPTLNAEYPKTATESALSWTKPSGTTEFVLRRKVVTGEGVRDSFPSDETQGTELYRGEATSFKDSDLTSGTWYYYSVFAFHPQKGWSLIDFSGTDAFQAGVSNQNWARGCSVTSNSDRNMVYGVPLMTTNGNKMNGAGTTNYNYIQRGWRPSGTRLWVHLDLGAPRAINRIRIAQASWYFQFSGVRIYTSTNNNNWKYAGGQSISVNNAAHGVWVVDRNTASSGRQTARYVRISYYQGPGQYYFGTGEVEIYS